MIKYSTGLVDFLMSKGSWSRAFTGGCIKVRTGSQPDTADKAVGGGTLLCTYSASGGTLTAEVCPVASVTLTGGTTGSITSITIGGYEVLGAAVPFNGTLAQTATDVATQINKFNSMGFSGVTAVAVSTKVTITAVQGCGNITGIIVITHGGDFTHSEVNMGTEITGVTQVNGILFGTSSGGILTKSGVWSGSAAATGTAGWFRMYGPIVDGDGASGTLLRMDGTCGTAGSDMDMATTSLVSGKTYTIDTGTFTLPLIV